MNADSVRLKRLGFIRGVVEDLSMGGTEGVSTVEQFHSAGAARTELAAEIAEDKSESPSAGSYAAFAIPGIPGAHGVSLLSGGREGSTPRLLRARTCTWSARNWHRRNPSTPESPTWSPPPNICINGGARSHDDGAFAKLVSADCACCRCA
jgi:hypothetical protein